MLQCACFRAQNYPSLTKLSAPAYGRGARILPPPHKTAIFRQVNLANPNAHHDALEFPNGEIVLLTHLMQGQQAVVLQLPATAKAPQRAAYVLAT